MAFGYAHLDLSPPGGGVRIEVAVGEVEAEVTRLADAIGHVRRHLTDHVRHFHAPTDEDLDQIVGAHQLILDDRQFIRGIVELIQNERIRAEHAVEKAFCAAADRLAGSRDSYLRARAEDIRDVCQSIRTALIHGEDALRPLVTSGRDTVFVTHHLQVSGVLRALRSQVVAVLTSSKAFASHAALLLRASGIPSIAGSDIPPELIADGTPLLVDGERGETIVNPSPLTRHAATKAHRAAKRHDGVVPPEAALTRDGHQVELWANIDAPDRMHECFEARLFGVGLFRTEFMMLSRGGAPLEEEQLNVYRACVEGLKGRPLVLRTFDIGAEKVSVALDEEGGGNPALGLRGLRRHLHRHPGELCTQLRAILRATADSDAIILLPMVTNVADLDAARTHLRAVQAELMAADVPHNQRVQLAAMVEIPSAALAIEGFLARMDYVTVGTNDLTQYLAAADRNNADVAAYLSPDASGLFTLLAWMAKRAAALGRLRDIFIGGEVAGSPEHAGMLARLGFSRLIVTPGAAAEARAAIAEVRRDLAPAESVPAPR